VLLSISSPFIPLGLSNPVSRLEPKLVRCSFTQIAVRRDDSQEAPPRSSSRLRPRAAACCACCAASCALPWDPPHRGWMLNTPVVETVRETQ
jgi:hypothetical protein